MVVNLFLKNKKLIFECLRNKYEFSFVNLINGGVWEFVFVWLFFLREACFYSFFIIILKEIFKPPKEKAKDLIFQSAIAGEHGEAGKKISEFKT